MSDEERAALFPHVALTLGYNPDRAMHSNETLVVIDRIIEASEFKFRWPDAIPVSERLPERGEEVLVYFQDSWWCVSILDYPKDHKHWFETMPNDSEPWMTLEDNVTHWMPLPPSPHE